MKIAYFMTRNIYYQIIPSLRSLLANNEVEKIYLFVEDDSVGFDLPEQCEVINISHQTEFTAANTPNWHSPFSWIVLMRSCIAKLIPDDRILMLDVDTVICGDLSDLWNTDMKDKWFCAAPEYFASHRPYGTKYYNVGVLLLNLEQIRKDGIDDKLIDFLHHKRVPYAEQDAWNALGMAKAMDMPVRYNECFATGWTKDPVIVHYAGIRNWYDNKSMKRREYLDRWMPPDVETR